MKWLHGVMKAMKEMKIEENVNNGVIVSMKEEISMKIMRRK